LIKCTSANNYGKSEK
jgi:hypothetical protein